MARSALYGRLSATPGDLLMLGGMLASLMSDEITCPECGGDGEKAIGPLRLRCQFCHGHGLVGGDHEPAEDAPPRADGFRAPRDGEEYDPDVHGPLPAIWEHPAARQVDGCPVCFGAGTVIGLGDIYGNTTGKLVELPCPSCSGRAAS